jgi:hypothetical protein
MDLTFFYLILRSWIVIFGFSLGVSSEQELSEQYVFVTLSHQRSYTSLKGVWKTAHSRSIGIRLDLTHLANLACWLIYLTEFSGMAGY